MSNAAKGARCAGVLICGLLLGGAAASLEPIEHPDPSAFSPGVAQAVAQARSRLERLEEGAPAGSAYGELGMVYQAHEMNLPATQAYRHAMELDPDDSRWPYLAAVIAAEQGRFADAVAGFSRVLELDPTYPPARIRRAGAYLKLGRRAAAAAELEALLQHQELAAAHAELGEVALLEGHYRRALASFERALELQPEASQLHYGLALAHRGLGDVEQARAHLGRRGERTVQFDDPIVEAMRGYSRSHTFYLSLALAASRARDYPAALELLRQAVAADPTAVDARIQLARALEANGEFDAAREQLNTVLAAEPEHPLAHFNLGVLAELEDQDAAALAHYRRALGGQPELFEARLLLANALLRAGRFGDAARQYDAALALRPERSELLLRRAVAEQAAGDCGRAVASLLRLVRRLPEDVEALLAYARCAASCPAAGPVDRENALNAARNLYRLRPGLDFVVTLAMAEAARGDYDAALEYQAQALFLAARDGRDEQQPFLRQLLQRYQARQPAQQPWPADHPLRNPRRISREDRL